MTKAKPYSPRELAGEGGQRTFSGPNAAQVAMPLGGIGTGCISLNAVGGLQDFAIYNRPAFSAMPDGHGATHAAFALVHIRGKLPITRLVEGPFPPERKYNFGLMAQGFRGGGHEGLPRFAKASLRGEYPFAYVSLSDPELPLEATVTGFNPFIPLDDRNSSIPCAILEYTLRNTSPRPVEFEFSYHLAHIVPGTRETAQAKTQAVPGAGVYFWNEDAPNAESFGSAALFVVGHKPVIKGMWLRGGWFDGISALWREVATGQFKANAGSNDIDTEGRTGGSLMVPCKLKPGEEVTIPIVIAWYVPNCNQTYGAIEGESCCEGPDCCGDPAARPAKWRPYYAGQWTDAKDVAQYVRKHYASLRSRTQAFHDALFASTVPNYVLDAVSANLAIMKSPTVLRLENGDLWGWEGCFCTSGCCHGSCTHVWNYAQAFPHLFPQLERTLREQELRLSMDERGHVSFRSALPEGRTGHGFHAASDGQLGGVMKVFREWQISGDAKWLAETYPLAKRSMDYCIGVWDPDRTGVLIEPHHNTYDIEFWGPDGMCSSIYLGALAAMAAMARAMGEAEAADEYEALAKRGAEYLDGNLFNGEYYEQKVTYGGLRDTSFQRMLDENRGSKSEVVRLLRSEGPKYQYGSGCISDGVIGAWMARIYGIDSPQTRAKVRRNLKAIFTHNFRPDLSHDACTQRPGYAWGDEPGLLLCTWPKGGKPTLPFVYSDEVWTGIEYQVASHLIEEGLVDEGLTIVKAVRSRHDGRVRNPWNEYECGSFYARAMSSYAILPSLAGFRYSAVEKTLHVGPKLNAKAFTFFFSTATGWGTMTLADDALQIDLVEGSLDVGTLVVERGRRTLRVRAGVKAKAGSACCVTIRE